MGYILLFLRIGLKKNHNRLFQYHSGASRLHSIICKWRIWLIALRSLSHALLANCG